MWWFWVAVARFKVQWWMELWFSEEVAFMLTSTILLRRHSKHVCGASESQICSGGARGNMKSKAPAPGSKRAPTARVRT